jgi:hypothetical protein
MRSLVGLALLLAAPAARAESPPPVIVRPVPPGMESYAQSYAAAHAPKTRADYRSGFTLRVSLGAGTFAVADRDGAVAGSGSALSLSLGGFVSRRFALYGHLEGSGGDADHVLDSLQLVGVGADWFVTDRWVIGGALGQAQADGWSEDGWEHMEYSGAGVHARVGYVVWQRRKHALDVTAAWSAGFFEDVQVQSVGLHVGYRFF